MDEHSPSKVGYEIGDYFGIAFINALADCISKSYDAGSAIGASAKEGLQTILSNLADLIDSDIDTQPTIRPVLDLSNIQNGENQLFNMMGRWNNYSMSGTLDMAQRAAGSMRASQFSSQELSAMKAIAELKGAVADLANSKSPFNATFYITGNNPKEIADEVSKRLQFRVERRGAVWGP